MREIKFRAWQPHTSLHRKPGMYVVDDMVWYEKDSEGHTGEVFLAKHIGWSQSSEYTDEVQLMQYTGLKDKNGVEIYEGDILDSTSVGVEFKDGSFIVPNYGTLIEYLHARSRRGTDSFIKGNIYENPELINNG